MLVDRSNPHSPESKPWTARSPCEAAKARRGWRMIAATPIRRCVCGRTCCCAWPGRYPWAAVAAVLFCSTRTIAPRGSQQRPVSAAPRRPALPLPLLPEDPRDLRQREIPRLPGSVGVSAPLGSADRAALPADVLAGGRPHRTRLAASARGNHPQSSLPDARRAARPDVRMARTSATLHRRGSDISHATRGMSTFPIVRSD